MESALITVVVCFVSDLVVQCMTVAPGKFIDGLVLGICCLMEV